MRIKMTVIVDTERNGEYKGKTLAEINKDLREFVEFEDGYVLAKAEIAEENKTSA